MQHLYQFLQSKRLPVKEILSCNCQITEKVDGSAFQYYKHQNKVMYGKRPNAPYE
jgi:ferredoxin